MSAPEVARRPARRTRLIAVVPLLVLLVALALVLAGRGAGPRDAAAAPTSAHGVHVQPTSGGPSGEATASASSPGEATASASSPGGAGVPDVADVADVADGTDAAGDAGAGAADVAVAPPGSVPVADPVTPADGHVLDAPTGTALGQAAGSPSAPVRVGSEALGEPRAAIDPADLVTSDTALGGCHPAYGDAGQCLPLVPPSMSAHTADMLAAGVPLDSMPHPWTCTELLLHFPDGIAVRQISPPDLVDPFGLDVEGDGMACAAS
ncbi:hypothetical protein [Serinibacter arcticus]|uniref:hypothetical protein n=1 Tax=Serinibacter arcticus TaxID=1655435 RepID=UPI0010930C03|nr:hypothetical protein [Serinibacter arcticus]